MASHWSALSVIAASALIAAGVVAGCRMVPALPTGERTCLGFPPDKMRRCADLLPAMARELGKNLYSTDKTLKRVYFGAEPNDTPVPPEAGYYVGYLVVESLARTTALRDLARLRASQVGPLIERELSRLAGSR